MRAAERWTTSSFRADGSPRNDCRVYLLEGDDLLPITAAGRTGGYERIDPDQLRVKVGEGFSGWVARHGTPLLIGDANADPRGVDIDGTEVFDESLVVVPMRYEERVIGVIAVARLGLDQFDESHQRLLRSSQTTPPRPSSRPAS